MSAVLYWERTNVHLLHLKQDNVIIPLPYTHEGWEEDLKEWSQIT